VVDWLAPPNLNIAGSSEFAPTPIWLLIVAGMALGVIVIVLVLAIPVSGEDFRYYTGYGFNGPFGGGGFGGLGCW